MTLVLHSIALCVALSFIAAPSLAQTMSKAEEALVTKTFQLSKEGRDLFNSGNFGAAEQVFGEVLRLHRDFGSGPLSIASSLHNLAAAIAEQGRLRDAEVMARDALHLRSANGAVDNAMVSSMQLLASILNDLEQFSQAVTLQQQVVDRSLNGDGVDQNSLVRNFASLAYLTGANGDVDGGIALVNQLVPLMQDMAPHDVVLVMNTVGRLSSMAGNPDQAELYYREAVSRSADLPVSGDWTLKDKAMVLNNLAAMLRQRGRIYEAEALFDLGHQILIDADLMQIELRATILDGLGEVYRAQGLFQKAHDVQVEALKIRQAILPETHASLGISYSNLGLTLMHTSDFQIASDAFTKALTIQRANGDTVRIANAATNLAGALSGLKQFDQAVTLAAEAQTLLAAHLAPDHPRRVTGDFNLAWFQLGAGDNAAALPLARQALATFRKNDWRLGDSAGGTTSARDSRRQVLSVVVALWETDRQGGMNEAFEAAQWAQASEAAHVARRVAARFAAGEGRIATLARAKQDLTNQWQAMDAQYLARLGAAGDQDERTRGLQAKAQELQDQIADVDAILETEFPQFAALTQPKSVSIADIQATLAANEAFFMPVSTPDETYVFAINAQQADWVRVALTDRQLDQSVRTLRADLDPSGRSRSAASLSDHTPKGLGFDRDTAFALYRDLVAPLNRILTGHDTVYTVKEGALAGLPLSLLLTAPVADSAPETLRRAPWLLRDHGFVTMPSASSLATQRTAQNPRRATTDFAGFGDPDFIGAALTEPAVELGAFYLRGVADGASVRALPRLPGTRQEILGLADLFQAPSDAVFLGTAATETAVKSAPALRNARVLVFATHGLLAGELSGLAEPALAFSAPNTPDVTDDGLLTASEAAQLDLVADWVILSACNTAAANGAPGGEGLSGLASSFLYAGARSLLVSHWPVRDDAAGLLTKGALQAQSATTSLGNAQSLRHSMLDLIENGRIPDAAHPSTWAPFTVVGGNG